jgi:hypothetical protein
MRIFTKIGWRSDTDCRWTNAPQGIALTIAPPMPLPPVYSRSNGKCRRIHSNASGAFRASRLAKALQWARKLTRRMK